MTMNDVISFGEMLIDFVSTESGVSLIDAPAFKKAPGGAPANVAVGLAKLGVPCGFMGKVGEDDFGHFLARTLEENEVDTSCLRFSESARTALAFVSLKADGERDFMFYRHPSADMLFEAGEVDETAIRAAKLFHFGSITLIDDPVRNATLHAAQTAREAGLLISYDPNLRLSLWPGADAAREGMLTGWPYAQYIKVSREEALFLSGKDALEEAAAELWHDDLRVLLVTDGAKGSSYFTGASQGYVPAFDVEVVDTTGAGDGFMAGFLFRLLADPSLADGPASLQEALRYANAVGALTTTRRGAIPALPGPEEVERLLSAG